MSYTRKGYKRKILKSARKILGDEKFNDLLSLKYLGYIPDLSKPVTFNEKIQWIKLYANLEDVGKYVDKYLVREYVRKTIGADALIPLLRVFKEEEDIDFSNLPNQFIMKASHGSGWNYIVSDLKNEDKNYLKDLAIKWLNKNYYNETGERNYKELSPSIVIEEIIGELNQELPDYKVHCFNGKPTVIQLIAKENNSRKGGFYTTDWKLLPFSKGMPNFSEKQKKPDELQKLIDFSEKLSHKFIYARVDMYIVKNKVYFGELTFTPAGGVSAFSDIKYDKKLGSYFNINEDLLLKG